MVFPCELISFAYNKSKQDNELNKINYQEWFSEYIAKKLNSNEIMFVPYIIGLMQIFLTAEECGFQIDKALSNLNINLTNTLTEQFIKPHNLEGKEIIHIMMGNPPYNVSSQNKSGSRCSVVR
jgi:predicted helicase